MAENFPNFKRKCKPTYLRSSTNPKQKYEEKIARYITIKIPKICDMEKKFLKIQ